MAFPFSVLDQRIEIDLGGTWTDITEWVLRRDQLVTIRRGRSDEAASVERSTARMTLNNRDGRFSTKNPLSPYFGQLNLNTRLRHSLPSTSGSYLDLPGSLTDEATCPDAAALGITGDIDIRIDLSPDSWRSLQPLAGKWEDTSDERSWALQLNADGTLTLLWSTSGALGTVLSMSSTLPVPVPGSHRRAVRVTLDVNNGASGRTARFYTADTISGSWTQLGATVTTSGTTSIYDSTAGLEVGSVVDLDPGDPYVGRVHAFELRSGIAGSVVANPDFTIQTAADNSFPDTASSPNTWTVAESARIDDRDYRIHAEVTGWPARWDISGTDVSVSVEASGILRRSTQGARLLNSTLRRGLTSLTETRPVAYWPCEDASGSTSIASALPGGRPMAVRGTPTFASASPFDCSGPLPGVYQSVWTGTVPPYTRVDRDSELRWLMVIPDGGLTNGGVVLRFTTTDATTYRWDLTYTTASGGSLTPTAYDKYGTLLHTGSPIPDLNGMAGYWSWQGGDSAGAIGYSVNGIDLVTGFGVSTNGGIDPATFGTISSVVVGPTENVDPVIGHISVHADILDPFLLDAPLRSYWGERAGRRMQRLCRESGVPFRVYGDLDSTPTMGVQGVDTLPNLILECAEADGGILSEPRTEFGFGYRPRQSLYNQETTLTLDYAAGELAGELAPSDDDRSTRNYVVVSRERGSSATAALETGRLSIQEPPDGIGIYPNPITINTTSDDELIDQAGWRMHLGTVDENRYQSISVNVANPRIAADSALVAAVCALDLGDVLAVSNPPAWVPPGTITQLVQGTTETYGNFEWLLSANGSPASPYNVAVVEGSVMPRVDSDGSVLGADATSSATTLVVATTQSTTPLPRMATIPQWTQDAAEFPFDLLVAGEQVTASAATGLAADTFTRTVAAGSWGTASDGHAWTLAGGSDSERSVASNRGVVTISSSQTTLRAQTVAETCQDLDALVTVAVSQTSAGGSQTPALLFRYEDTSDHYRLRVHFTTGGNINLSVTRGSTQVDTNEAIGISYSPGDTFRLRARVIGHRVLGKVWASGSAEPGDWQIDRTVTSSPITSGLVGLGAAALSGNTNTGEYRFDDLTIFNPQRLTVTRSVNGIVKTQTAGGDVRLAVPAITSF